MLAKNLYTYNPIDDIECFFASRNHSSERRNSHEIIVEIPGKWNDVIIFFAWEESMKCLHISSPINLENEYSNTANIFELLALLNADLWMGCFSYWEEAKLPIFRHSLLIDNEEFDIYKKISQIVEIAKIECERAYPIFHAVIKQNIPPRKALLPITLM